MRIPYIARWAEKGGVHAAFGLALRTIQHESCLGSVYQSPPPGELWKLAHQRNARLLQTLSRAFQTCSIELHLVSRPSLDGTVPGSNHISIMFHVRADTESRAVELALTDSVQLEPVLDAFWPSAEFTTVEKDQFQERFTPFVAQSCLLVGRREEPLCPAQPFSVDKPQIGFQVASGSTPTPSCVAKSVLRHVYPWVPSFGEDWEVLLESLLRLPTPRWIVIRVGTNVEQARRSALVRLGDAIDVCERFLAGANQGQITLTAQAQIIRDSSLNRYAQIADAALSGAVLVFAPGRADHLTANLLGQSITGDHARRQIENVLEGGFAVHPVDPASAGDSFTFFEKEPFTAEEAACAFRLPMVTAHSDLGLDVRKCRSVEFQVRPVEPDSLSKTHFGVNLHRGFARLIEINLRDRLRHALYIGATGVGKSTMLLSAMLQDARAGRGLALIDPPGELADDFLARFPRERVEDLVIVDFEDRDFPVPLNLLSWQNVQERDLLIDTLFSTLLGIYKNSDFFGPVFESHFRSGLRLLLGDRPRTDFTPTLLELPQVFRNQEFRKYLQATSQDDDVKGTIQEADRVSYGEHKLENIAPWVNAKFARFLQDTQLRRIVGNGRMALDFRAIMDQGKIAVFKLAQGRLGKHISDILVAQIVARFRLAAMSRADTPPLERKPFFLYCDEFQVIADENFAQMLSQCRKYALGLVLANQYATQLREKGVLDAVLANVGTLASYRVGAEDAKLLAPVFAPTVGAHDLVECPNWQGYMRLHSSRIPTRPFSFHNLPDPTPVSTEWARQLCEVSRRRWGVPAEATDQRILHRNRFIRGLPESASQTCAPLESKAVADPEDVTAEDVMLSLELDALIEELEAEKPQWCARRDESARLALTDVQSALMQPFLFFLTIKLDWFLALAKSLVNRRALRAADAAAFLGSVLDDPRVGSSARERLKALMRGMTLAERIPTVAGVAG